MRPRNICNDVCTEEEINHRHKPVLHLLIPVVSNWQLLVETVVRGVAGRVVNNGGVSGKVKMLDFSLNPD